MVEITASTKHAVKKKAAAKAPVGNKGVAAKISTARRGSIAPPLQPALLTSVVAIAEIKALNPDDRKKRVSDSFRQALGESTVLNLTTPHAASTTRNRGMAAADVAVAARECGMRLLKDCGILNEMQLLLFPQGIEAVLKPSSKVGLKPSLSALSLSSMADADTVTTAHSGGTDTKRGKTTPPNAREGCLLLLRALSETVGKPAEPYVVGAFLAAALDECSSSNSAIREAAEDATAALVNLAHPWSVPSIIVPLLLQSLETSEWRIKAIALERLSQCTLTAPRQIYNLIPTLIPQITSQVWDTKTQVSKGARVALLAICETTTNPDIRPAIPAVVNAISKPAETNAAVSELMSTTFVVPVDASTLAILCPVLARALKEKLAIHKRAACIVVANMSKLVETPEAVAPFGSLLVPELKKVCQNVQFEEIRDEALKALSSLTKALGDSYALADDAGHEEEMHDETEQVEAEQDRIKQEREAEQKREEELKRKEAEEKRRWKEAMDAQRELDKIATEESQKKKQDEELQREKQKLSTKDTKGVCQACGLKKCKKSCMFYSK